LASEELRAAEVPTPYMLFSQMRIVGRFHSLAYATHEQWQTSKILKGYLTLVARTITVQSKHTVLLAHVLLRETHTSTNKDLSSDDTTVSEEGWGKGMEPPFPWDMC